MSTDQTNQQPDPAQDNQQPQLADKTIIIAPLQLIEEDGAQAYDRAVDRAVEHASRIQLAERFAQRLPAPEVVTRFIDAQLAEIRALNQRGHRHRGQGCVYILDRLDEPPPEYAPGYSIDTTQKPSYIGGYQAVFARLDQLRGDQLILAAAREHSRPNTVVLRVCTADDVNPDAYDKPYILVIPSDYTPAPLDQAGDDPPGAAQPNADAQADAARPRRRGKGRRDPMD